MDTSHSPCGQYKQEAGQVRKTFSLKHNVVVQFHQDSSKGKLQEQKGITKSLHSLDSNTAVLGKVGTALNGSL